MDLLIKALFAFGDGEGETALDEVSLGRGEATLVDDEGAEDLSFVNAGSEIGRDFFFEAEGFGVFNFHFFFPFTLESCLPCKDGKKNQEQRKRYKIFHSYMSNDFF